jgi:hypothetical protein
LPATLRASHQAPAYLPAAAGALFSPIGEGSRLLDLGDLEREASLAICAPIGFLHFASPFEEKSLDHRSSLLT